MRTKTPAILPTAAGLLLSLVRPCSSAAADVQLGDRVRGAYFGALVSDALCLGSHYEYDAKVIAQAYGGQIQKYMGPGEQMGGTTHGVGWGRRNYHPGQKAGDQTDYGLYNVLMLEYFAKVHGGRANQDVELAKLIPMWRKRLESDSWGAWRCTQTKQTLQQVAGNVPFSQLGGMSNAMGVRSAGLFGAYDDEDKAAAAARKLSFTHKSEEALVGADFFTRVTHKVIFQSLKPSEAIAKTCAQMRSQAFVRQQCEKGTKKFEEVSKEGSTLAKEKYADDLAMTSMARLWEVGKTEPIKVGKASPTEGTMPSSIYMILKYENDFEGAVKANAMVGGDNASRSIAIGMVLGAYHGASGIPKYLRDSLNAWKESEEMLSRLPLLAKTKDGKRAEEL